MDAKDAKEKHSGTELARLQKISGRISAFTSSEIIRILLILCISLFDIFASSASFAAMLL